MSHPAEEREAGGQPEPWMVPGPYSGRGPKGYQRSDERIFEEVCERLSQHGQLDASEIEVTVSGGEVTLSGTVESRGYKRLAEELADSVLGVQDVHNELRLRQSDWRESHEFTMKANNRG